MPRTASAFAASARRRESARAIAAGFLAIAISAAFVALCMVGVLAG